MTHTRTAILFITKLSLCAVALFTIPVPTVQAGPGESCNGRIIVKYKNAGKSTAQLNKQQISALQIAGKNASVSDRRILANGAHLIQRGKNNSEPGDAEFLRQLNSDPDIEYAECDARRRIHYTPNDPQFPGNGPLFIPQQWYLTDADGGINAATAWDTTRNRTLSPTVVAVIDTGIANLGTPWLHEDLDAGRILPGYDFISEESPGNFFTANDNNGRDDDPSDPGDAVSANECGTNDPGEDIPSSWHGTAITGLIAATYNNSTGIAGIDQNSRILPVRALGKCGGFISDITDGIRWAAGLHISGVPDNPNPADVINLSFGSDTGTGCSNIEQDAINAAVNAGALVVVSSGNEGVDINGVAPADCNNVLVVTATTRQGGETCYTNTGTKADIAAPGGNDDSANCPGSIADTLAGISNDGITGPNPAVDAYGAYAGTSFSTPMVSAAAALIKAGNPLLTSDEIGSVLVSTARPFPQGTRDGFDDCTIARCGAGILDIAAAVELASGIDITPAVFSFDNQNDIAPNTAVTSNSITVSGINALSPVSVSGGTYSINGGDFTSENSWVTEGDSVVLQMTSPATASSSGTVTLTIGGVTADFTVTTQANTSNPLDDGGNGGGGSLGWLVLSGLLGISIRGIRR